MSRDLSDRVWYLDYLRVIAVVAVILIHITAGSLTMVEAGSRDWLWFVACGSLVRWGVPIFFMISGALFLDREVCVKTIYSKYIVRMITAFTFWAVMYALVGCIFDGGDLSLATIIPGYYHMWFIVMIIGIYVCIPIFRSIARDEKVCRYFLVLFVVIQVIIPFASRLLSEFGGDNSICKILILLINDILAMKIYSVMGYGGYFVLGYYLSRNELSKRLRRIVYCLGVAGYLITVTLTIAASDVEGQFSEDFYGYFMPGVLLMAVAIFAWFKNNCDKQFKAYRFFGFLAPLGFGVYLVHVMVIEQLFFRFSISVFSFGNVAFGTVIITIIVFVVSNVISVLLHSIPVVGKYIT